jgi:NADH-quinone oxidoreductase subunit C
MALPETIATIEGKFQLIAKREFRGETTLIIQAADLIELCRFARESLGFDLLVDVSSVDNFGEEPRFDMVYELVNAFTNEHVRLKFSVSEDELTVPSVSGIWDTANWHEREIFDMMGINFSGHPDLRRILMWDGYPYYPLRKDFPLAGKLSEVPEVALASRRRWRAARSSRFPPRPRPRIASPARGGSRSSRGPFYPQILADERRFGGMDCVGEPAESRDEDLRAWTQTATRYLKNLCPSARICG